VNKNSIYTVCSNRKYSEISIDFHKYPLTSEDEATPAPIKICVNMSWRFATTLDKSQLVGEPSKSLAIQLILFKSLASPSLALLQGCDFVGKQKAKKSHRRSSSSFGDDQSEDGGRGRFNFESRSGPAGRRGKGTSSGRDSKGSQTERPKSKKIRQRGFK
jgi:hypothetical protein